MLNFLNVALGFIGAAGLASASDVIELKTDTFLDFITENPLVLAEFYAPWCGHCKALAPEYEDAATTLKDKDIKLVKVDCTEESGLCQSYGVEGYPTLKIFRGIDNISPYSGQRKAQAITSYMIKQSMPAVSVLTADTIEDFKTSDEVVLVSYFEVADKTSNETFTTVAETLRNKFLFGATNDEALAEAAGVTRPAVVLYKKFDEGKTPFTGNFEAEAIETFAKTASIPLVGEVGPETYADYIASGIPLAYIFAETPEERTKLSELLRPVAGKHKGKVNFATIDAKAFGAHASNLNLKTDNFPAFAIQETVKNQKFPYDQEKKINHDDIDKFVQDFVDGKIDPSIKSEPVPESQDGPVYTVVAHNYDEIVLKNDKDVLLEFYAPWCGHCKALAPKYEELASLYFNDPDYSKKVIIAKVDATANDVPDNIEGFPTIKLFPAGAKDAPVTYSGPRTIDDLAKFVAENGKYKVQVDIPVESTSETQSSTDQASTATEVSSESSVTEATETGTEIPDAHDEL